VDEADRQVPEPIDELAPTEAQSLEARRVEPVRYFAAAFSKAVKSYNLYARNNEALLKFLDDAHRHSQSAFEAVGDLELNVRRESLTCAGQVVLEDPDRETGIPFRLFREGVRRFTLEIGLEQAELNQVIEILAKPPMSGDLDDDLVSNLWRAAVPHVRYVTLDVYAVTASADGESPEEDQEQEEIRQDLDRLLSAIYQGAASEEDGVKAVNISSDDLVALATLGDEREEETSRIGQATARAIFNVGEDLVDKLQQEIAAEKEADLLELTYDVLLGVLFRVKSGAESQKVIQEILNLYDSLLLSRDFNSAGALVKRMHDLAQGGDLKNLAIVGQLLKLIGTEQRLAQVTVAINDGMVASASQVLPLLHALGEGVVPIFLSLMPGIQQPQHRRLLCDMMVEVRPPTIEMIRGYWGQADWFIDRDLLYLAQRSGDPGAIQFVLEGCEHPHARVRQQALGMLQQLPTGPADAKLVAALQDDDQGVRITAVRTLMARRATSVGQRLHSIVVSEDFEGRDQGEQRTFLVAFANLAGSAAVPVLDQILNGSQLGQGGGFLERLRSKVEATMQDLADPKIELRCAAAVALGSIMTPDAAEALHKGARSREKEIKDVCERTLVKRRGESRGGA